MGDNYNIGVDDGTDAIAHYEGTDTVVLDDDYIREIHGDWNCSLPSSPKVTDEPAVRDF